MSDPNHPCLICSIAADAQRPVGGTVYRGEGLLVTAPLDPSPIPGWLVLASERHARALYDLEGSELAALGPLTARVMRAQRSALGAEHVYAFAIGDLLHHFHLHLVPRFADTPNRLRGRGCFDARPQDALPAWQVIAAVEAVRKALSGAP